MSPVAIGESAAGVASKGAGAVEPPCPSPCAACIPYFTPPYTRLHKAVRTTFPTVFPAFPIFIYTPLAFRHINQ